MTHSAPSTRAPRILLVLSAALLVPPLTAYAQAGGGATLSPKMQQAMGFLQSQKFAEAASTLENVTEEEPENAQAWYLLGFAYHNLQEWDKAIAADTKAAAYPQTAPNALYNLAMAYARKGDKDRAFEWLGKAKATGKVNMTQAGVDPDTESLRDDPRFKMVYPTVEEFADPFVEPVTIIQEWVGEGAGDQYGWIARNIGDVDGDGVDDVTTSAPSFGQEGSERGKVYTYSSRSGRLLWTHTGEQGDQLGLGIEAAGDVDADGVPDVIAGAPGGDHALVLSGRDGEVLLTLTAPQKGSTFGREVGDIGDVDHDGFADVLVGAPTDDAAGEDAGRAFVYSGRDGSVLLTLQGEEAGDRFGASGGGLTKDGRILIVVGAPNAGEGDRGRVYVYEGLTMTPKFIIESDETGFQLGGMFVSVVGDVDADGVPDVYASDWANLARGRSTGRVYVHSGADGHRIYTLTGEAAGDGFGIGVADAGDVDGDGHDDLVIGAWQQASAAPSGGKTYVYSGADGHLMWGITGKVPGETFGFDATGMGDVDGDGTVDFLLTSAWSAIRGPQSGRMFIISGKRPPL